MRRPAETATAGVAVAGLVAAVVSHDELAAAYTAIGLVPAVVTFWVSHGGWDGMRARFLHGASEDPPA